MHVLKRDIGFIIIYENESYSFILENLNFVKVFFISKTPGITTINQFRIEQGKIEQNKNFNARILYLSFERIPFS